MNSHPRTASLGLLALALLFLSGCFDYEYVTAEIRDVMKGTVPSAASRYRVPLPEIPIVRKNVGIVREGGLFVVVVSPDLKSTLTEHAGKNVELGVHFKREPRRHLVLERIWVDGAEREVCDPKEFRYRLPDLVNAADIPFDQFEQIGLCEVPPQDEAILSQVTDRKIYASEFHVRKQPIPESLVGTQLVTATSAKPDRPQYFITSEGADYLVASRDPMTFLMLDFLLHENREFQGGIRVAGVFDPEDRVATRVAGAAEIDWIALGGPMYFRSH
ncbi:MAG: hypothetical protein DHS20C21_06270 [Gemmatimonadota bacterium]|nr:MAG: hypothetical protein DHS20C21_06270 [Gemmatimonadota bacterium]